MIDIPSSDIPLSLPALENPSSPSHSLLQVVEIPSLAPHIEPMEAPNPNRFVMQDTADSPHTPWINKTNDISEVSYQYFTFW